jgi:hypothetical protein
MNDKDMNNILFILTSSQEKLEQWWHSIDDEDKEYAMWIIKSYQEELIRMEKAYDDSLPLDSEEDLSLAKEYLKKFQL